MNIKEEDKIVPKVPSNKQASIEKKVIDKAKETPVEGPGVFIYVGPTTKQLNRYASFTGGLPTHMEEHFEKCKVLKKMFIPTSDFVAFEQRLRDPASIEKLLFNKVLDYFNGEVNTL